MCAALREESGGYLLTAQVVSGMEVARAWSGLLRGTREPVASKRTPVDAGGERERRQEVVSLKGVEYRSRGTGRTVS